MSGWKFSFIMAIGIGLITGAGIAQGVTTDHGEISNITECPIHCGIYLLIFVTMFGVINEFDMQISNIIGGRGSETSTGTDGRDAITNTRCEKSVTGESGTATTAGTKAKENTSTKTVSLSG
jgi:hypothetical protein